MPTTYTLIHYYQHPDLTRKVTTTSRQQARIGLYQMVSPNRESEERTVLLRGCMVVAWRFWGKKHAIWQNSL